MLSFEALWGSLRCALLKRPCSAGNLKGWENMYYDKKNKSTYTVMAEINTLFMTNTFTENILHYGRFGIVPFQFCWYFVIWCGWGISDLHVIQGGWVTWLACIHRSLWMQVSIDDRWICLHARQYVIMLEPLYMWT